MSGRSSSTRSPSRSGVPGFALAEDRVAERGFEQHEPADDARRGDGVRDACRFRWLDRHDNRAFRADVGHLHVHAGIELLGPLDERVDERVRDVAEHRTDDGFQKVRRDS